MDQFNQATDNGARVWMGTLVLAMITLFFTAPAPADVTVNINTADAVTLATELSGVGPRLAQRIVDFRERYGEFESLEALTDVRGIGDALLEKNTRKIVLE